MTRFSTSALLSALLLSLSVHAQSFDLQSLKGIAFICHVSEADWVAPEFGMWPQIDISDRIVSKRKTTLDIFSFLNGGQIEVHKSSGESKTGWPYDSAYRLESEDFVDKKTSLTAYVFNLGEELSKNDSVLHMGRAEIVLKDEKSLQVRYVPHARHQVTSNSSSAPYLELSCERAN